MSDPVTNAEVEDVLSSIRRLVSEDKRPMQAFKEPEPQAAEPSDRLVLTPALRVADAPAAEEGADTADAPQSADDFARDVQQMTAAAEPAHAEVEVSDAGNGGETVEADLHKLFEDEASSEEQTAPDQDYSDDPYGFADDEDADGAEDEQSWLRRAPEDEEAHDGEDAPVGTASLTAKIEALETAIGNISDTWEPDAPGEDEYSGTDAPAMSWEDEANDQPEPAQQEEASQDAESDALAVMEDSTDEDEDEDTSPGIFASTRHHAADATEILEESAPEADVMLTPPPMANVSSAADEGDFEYEQDDQVIDEEALRDLVSEIVRSELQGALGERITRNVRKLVRREIHRALTAQEME
jgi:hypothetical protein